MTLQTPPSWLQAGSYPAAYDRLTQQALYATTGIIGSSSLEVTQNSPAGMSVRVASGWAAIVGNTQPQMGVYTIYNDATATLTVTTANPSNPRIDRVVVTVRDAYYSGTNNDVIFQVIAGTPAASPVAPATPSDSISLATITVGAGVTSITTANITDTRVAVTTNLPLPTGDITSVTAGTGLTGGGTSGDVTLAIDSTVATLTGTQTLTNKSLTSPKINVGINSISGATYTTVLDDNGKLIVFTSNVAVTATLPSNGSVAYPVGAQINFTQTGTGQVTIVGTGGVTVVSTGATASQPKINKQYSAATAIQTSTDNWIVFGDVV